MAMQTEKSVQ